MKVALPDDWRLALGAELSKEYFVKLSDFVDEERRNGEVFPPEDKVFSAFSETPLRDVKVVILGQDPYHDNGQAHGMCFSVQPGVAVPPSLVNIYRELRADLGCTVPSHGYLLSWARQGVLLLNAVLTVRAHEPNSHKSQGWETFTDAAIRCVNDRPEPAAFVLWGNYAKKKGKLIDATRHRVIEGAHPSPLSVKRFMGSKPFSKVNTALRELGHAPIDWQVPAL